MTDGTTIEGVEQAFRELERAQTDLTLAEAAYRDEDLEHYVRHAELAQWNEGVPHGYEDERDAMEHQEALDELKRERDRVADELQEARTRLEKQRRQVVEVVDSWWSSQRDLGGPAEWGTVLKFVHRVVDGSYADLADTLGTSAASVSRYINSIQTPPRDTIDGQLLRLRDFFKTAKLKVPRISPPTPTGEALYDELAQAANALKPEQRALLLALSREPDVLDALISPSADPLRAKLSRLADAILR